MSSFCLGNSRGPRCLYYKNSDRTVPIPDTKIYFIALFQSLIGNNSLYYVSVLPSACVRLDIHIRNSCQLFVRFYRVSTFKFRKSLNIIVSTNTYNIYCTIKPIKYYHFKLNCIDNFVKKLFIYYYSLNR